MSDGAAAAASARARLAARLDWLAPVAAAAVLVATSLHAFLLFHVLAEVFAIVVAVMAFFVAMHTWRFSRDDFLLVLGSGFFWIAGLDLWHTVAFKGMGVIPGTESDANMATQVWVAARLLQGVLLILAPLALGLRDRLHPVLPWGLFGLGSVAVGASILTGVFPDAYVEGSGLTTFKIVGEGLVILLLAGSAALFARRRTLLRREVYLRMMAVLALSAVSEICFSVYVDVTASWNVAGHVFKFLAFWMVAQVIVQAALTEPFSALERTARIYDAVPDPTLLVNRAGTVLHANMAAEARFGPDAGATPGRLVGLSLHSLGHPQHLPPYRCPICSHVLAGNVPGDIEVEDDGQGRSLLVSLTPLDDDPASSIVVVMRDITALVEAEAQVRSRSEELARSNAELQHFATVASHDLREPLRMVSSYLGLLERRLGTRLPREEREFLNYALDGADRMSDMIDGLLLYARVDTQGRPFETLDMTEVVADALENLRVRLQETDARVSMPRALPQLTGDREQLTRLFQNLIANALKYHQPGRAPEIEILVEDEPDGGRRYGVRDHGIGIPAEAQGRLFRLFSRAHSNVEGLGVGLAVSRRIVERHGGRIWAESREGRGSVFWFTLAPQAPQDDDETDHALA